MTLQSSTFSEFLEPIQSVLETIPEDGPYRPLEEYLRALWALVQIHSGEIVSYSVLVQVVTQALEAPPVSFDSNWLEYTKLPNRNEIDNDYEYLRATILCQIADLHRMEDMQISPLDRYGGIHLPTGNNWYNFSLNDFLWQAINGFKGHKGLFKKSLITSVAPNTELDECNWFVLAHFLWLGEYYE